MQQTWCCEHDTMTWMIYDTYAPAGDDNLFNSSTEHQDLFTSLQRSLAVSHVINNGTVAPVLLEKWH